MTKFRGIRACVFDAYGTLLDVHSAVAKHRSRLGEKADAVSAAWRTKQLEYSWQRTILDRYVDFWRLTSDGLDFALDAHGVDDAALRDDLLDAYQSLDCFPEVPGVLKTLREAGLATAILSNAPPMMLEAAVESAGIGDRLDAVISADRLGVYKPSAQVYRLALDELDVARTQVSFQSSNGWDAAGAATFGFRVVWCNRTGQARERMPDAPDVEVRTLDELPAIVLP
ncbi:MAG: haloacid dehalogenase type II [Thiotrichales bacterium]|nr:haloacid dehalogenase type II [Thiotrichales bacterium]